ncbi:MAG: bifunctional hydroxymethylpyrimidine kinase/phosphomethylpyrimidine kinase [Selenomonadaceae bacterium]|nr:bifunctional hydroxymethylpyrimidine kinase/phosphomethylpyrimidine kinase [Selenomonadaceae bacterium]
MSTPTKYIALTVAGSDCSGGAGIQADLKTFLANGVYGMSVVTALTAQNTCGVRAVMNSTPEFLRNQLDAVFEDIFPDAVKIGMVSSAQLIDVIADKLSPCGVNNIVVDPVMIATSGARLIDENAVTVLKMRLFPIAKVITPNLPELEAIADEKISSPEDMERIAAKIFDEYGCAVLAKGGHGFSDASDFLFDGVKGTWFYGKRIDTKNTHGTGCTLSSAIAANLAKGYDLIESVGRAKSYLTGALMNDLNIGKGNGALNHGFNLHGSDFND